MNLETEKNRDAAALDLGSAPLPQLAECRSELPYLKEAGDPFREAPVPEALPFIKLWDEV